MDEARVRSRMTAALSRFGCGADSIATRGYELDDCDHTRWADMEVYRLDSDPRGAGMLTRTLAFSRIAGAMLERVEQDVDEPPSDLLHVTCTGYSSPSPAQELVARRGWGSKTRVAHAYHMGCYAALPALRAACGAQAASGAQPGARPGTEVVHTEVCSLHVNPASHEAEQFVIQSLFADGCIAYRVADARLGRPSGASFELLGMLERIVPDSAAAMTWRCSEWGMQMTLARDVPERLGAALRPFVDELTSGARLGERELREALFAVHPGGPRILDRVGDLLRLEPEKLAHSRKVLRERGNLSSATLPHIWMELARDPEVPAGVPIAVLAFGPGLTLCGAVLRKHSP